MKNHPFLRLSAIILLILLLSACPGPGGDNVPTDSLLSKLTSPNITGQGLSDQTFDVIDLDKQANARQYISTANVGSGYKVLGNGSLIPYHAQSRPKVNSINVSTYPQGLYKDFSMTHPGLGKQIAFFQWQINRKCTGLELSYEGKSTTVDITVGYWSDRDTDVTFKRVQLPFLLNESNTGFSKQWFQDKQWLLVAVAFDSAVSEDKIVASCSTKSNSGNQAGNSIRPVPASPIMIDGHQWNGNGSILAQTFDSYWGAQEYSEEEQWPYGAFIDQMILQANGNKPVVYFQWNPSDHCNALAITTQRQLSARESRVHVGIKYWSADSFVPATLPIILQGAREDWYIVSIAFDNPISKDTRIDASCVNKQPNVGRSQLATSSTTLSFTDAATHTVVLSNIGKADSVWALTDKPDWLTVSPESGTIHPKQKQTISISSSACGEAYSQNGKLIFKDDNSEVTINVTRTCSQQTSPSLNIRPGSYNIESDVGSAIPALHPSLKNEGTAVSNFRVEDKPSWVDLTPSSGSIAAHSSKVLTINISSCTVEGTETGKIIFKDGSSSTSLLITRKCVSDEPPPPSPNQTASNGR